MKMLLLLAVICLFAVGCTHGDHPTGEVGNGLGGGTVGNSFSGSSGAGAKAATGTAQGNRSVGEGDTH